MIWLTVSISIGILTFNKIPNESNHGLAESCMTIGMIGTVIGFILMLGTSLNNLDPRDVELMKTAISNMAVGMSTPTINNLTGLLVHYCLEYNW